MQGDFFTDEGETSNDRDVDLSKNAKNTMSITCDQ